MTSVTLARGFARTRAARATAPPPGTGIGPAWVDLALEGARERPARGRRLDIAPAARGGDPLEEPPIRIRADGDHAHRDALGRAKRRERRVAVRRRLRLTVRD